MQRAQGTRAGLWLTLIAASGVAAAEAQRPAPVIEVGLDLVRIDASVTDSKGRPVTDLRPEDFRLRVDGKPRPVDNAIFFGREEAAGADADASAAAGAASGRQRSLVFLIDDLNMSGSSMYSAQRALKAFATGWNAEEALVGVRLTSDRDETVRLSRNRSTLDAAIGALRYNIRSDKGASSGASYGSAYGDDIVPAITPNGPNAAQLRANFEQRISSLVTTIDALRSVPGRKAVLVVSEGLTVEYPRDELGLESPFDSLFADSTSDATLRMIVEVANRASVVLYTMDPSGLVADWLDAGEARIPSPTVRNDASESRLDIQGTLARLAYDTGGLAVYNRNNLKRGFAEIVEDQRSYYLIGFEPPESTFSRSSSGAPKFHEIKLAVNRPGVRVRTRAGFYGVTDEDVLKRAPLVSVPAMP
jgi:VWFA-related protein